MKKRKYWIRFHITTCPVCSHGNTYRERMYGRKPKSYAKRYIFIDNYDWCLE